MNKTILAVSGAGLAGLVVFLFIQCSTVSVDKEGVQVGMGGGEAEAGCFQDGPNCLPPMDFVDEDGVKWTPEALAGKVVVINFWASWCAPCKSEIPDLARVYRKYKDQGVVMLGLMTDEISDKTLSAFQKRYGMNYPVVRVKKAISEAFGDPPNLPTNFVYSRSGHLMFDSPGAITAGALEREIKELL